MVDDGDRWVWGDHGGGRRGIVFLGSQEVGERERERENTYRCFSFFFFLIGGVVN